MAGHPEMLTPSEERDRTMTGTHHSTARYMTALALGLVLAATATAAEDKGPVKLEAQPPRIDLKNPFAYAQVPVTAQLASGERIDATRLAQIDRPENTVRVSPTGLVRPVADGEGALKIGLAGQSVTIPVKVSGQKDKYAVSFTRDVMP